MPSVEFSVPVIVHTMNIESFLIVSVHLFDTRCSLFYFFISPLLLISGLFKCDWNLWGSFV